MKLHAELISDDYVKAQFVHLRPRPFFKWLGYVIATLAVGVTLLQFFLPPEARTSWEPVAVIVAGVYFAVYFFILIPYQAKKVFRQQKTLQEACDLEITPEGLMANHSRGTWNMKWKDFHKCKIGKDLILVYQSDLVFHMFPKRWFSDEEYTLFQSYLKDALGEAVR